MRACEAAASGGSGDCGAAAGRCLRAAAVSVAVAAADWFAWAAVPAAGRAEGALGRGAISDTRRL